MKINFSENHVSTSLKIQFLVKLVALVYIQHIFLIYSRTLFDFIPALGAYDWGKTVPQFYDSLRTDWLCKQTSRNGDCWLHGKNLILQILHSSKKSAMVIFPSSEMIISDWIGTWLRNTLPAQSPNTPILRANPYPKVTDPICRLPLPTLFYRPEAIHLGDLLRIWVRADATPP